jgi:hypothetical protein
LRLFAFALEVLVTVPFSFHLIHTKPVDFDYLASLVGHETLPVPQKRGDAKALTYRR